MQLNDTHTHPYPGRFVASLVDMNFLIIALMVEWNFFPILWLFSYCHFLFCDAHQSFVAHQNYFFFTCWMIHELIFKENN